MNLKNGVRTSWIETVWAEAGHAGAEGFRERKKEKRKKKDSKVNKLFW